MQARIMHRAAASSSSLPWLRSFSKESLEIEFSHHKKMKHRQNERIVYKLQGSVVLPKTILSD